MTKKRLDAMSSGVPADHRDQADERALEQFELMDLKESLAAIEQSEREYAQGKGIDALQAIREIAAKHDLKLRPKT